MKVMAATWSAAMDHPFFLAGIVFAFVMFGIVLAYVDRIAARRPDAHPAE